MGLYSPAAAEGTFLQDLHGIPEDTRQDDPEAWPPAWPLDTRTGGLQGSFFV